MIHSLAAADSTIKENSPTPTTVKGQWLNRVLAKVKTVWVLVKTWTYHGFSEGPNQGKDEPIKPPVAWKSRTHHVARVHGIGHYPVGRQPVVELVGEQNVAQLGVVVGWHVPVAVAFRGQLLQANICFLQVTKSVGII